MCTGSALAFQGPIEYRYKYAARIGTGIQSGRPQYAGTGLRADVKITIDQEGEALFEVSNKSVIQFYFFEMCSHCKELILPQV